MSSHSVLIIDDDSAVREAVASVLQRDGYALFVAENGQEGLSLFRETCPTVVILDLIMPVMDGLGFLSEIDFKPSDPYSVIVLTAHGDDDSLDACYKAGITAFLQKPFNTYELRGLVKNAIAIKQHSSRLDDLVRARTVELEQSNEQLKREIAERKWADEKLRENETRLQMALEASHATTFDMNAQTGEGVVSGDIAGVYGLDPGTSALSFPDFLEMVHPDDRESLARENARGFKTGEVPQVEFRIVWPNKEVHWIQARGEVLYDADGNPIRMIGLNTNITERKQTEQDLRESEGRFSSLVEHAGDAIFLHNADGAFMNVNQQACNSLGYTRKELLNLHLVDIVVDLPVAEMDTMLRQLGIGTPASLDAVHRRKDGTTFPVEVRLASFESVGGPLFICLARDITERKQAEEEVRRLDQELQASMDEMAVVDEVARIITSTLDIDKVYEQFAAAIKTLIDFDRVNIIFIDHDSNTFQLAYLTKSGPSSFAVGEAFPLENSATGFVSKSRTTLIYDINESKFWTSQHDLADGFKSEILLPLISKDRVIGVFALLSSQNNSFGPREQVILERLANQIAPAVENAQLYAQLRSHAEEMSVVDEVARIITSTLDIGDVYEQFAAAIKTLIDFDQVDIITINQDSNTFQIAYLTSSSPNSFPVGEPFPLENTGIGFVFDSRSPLVYEVNEHPEFWTGQHVLADGFSSEIVLPLISKDRVIGSLVVLSKQNNSFGPREQAILERLANQIAPAVENARLYGQLRSHAEEMSVVDEVARIITSNLDIGEVYERFASEVAGLMDVDQARISIVDESKGTLTCAYVALQLGSAFKPGETVPLEGTTSGQVAQTRESFIVGDLGEEPRLWSAEQLVNDGFRSSITVPLIAKDKLIATLTLFSEKTNSYGDREQVILERLASQIAPAIDNSRLFWEVQQLSLALASIGDSVNFVDLEGNLLFVNKAFEQLYGYTPDEVLGRFGGLLAAPGTDIASEVKKRLMESALHGVWRGEINRVRKNGEEFPAFLTVSPVRDSSGQVLGFIGVTQDLTESKRAELELSTASSRLEALVTNLESGILFVDEFRLVQYANPAFCRMLGFPSPEFILGGNLEETGEQVKGLFRDANNFIPRIESLIKERAIVIGEELALVDGRTFERDYIPVSSAAGFLGNLWHYRDVTDRKLAEERIRDASRLASVGELASGVAHEVNNPLAVVLGFSQLVLDQNLPSSAREDILQIYEHAKRASKVMENLLVFARKYTPERRYIDITIAVTNAIALKAHEFSVSNVDIIFDPSPDIPHTMADEHQLQQVFLNIISNAGDAMVGAHGRGTLHISVMQVDTNVRLSFTDDGPGISPENLGRIFDPFFTTKEVGKGTGLGLSICYGIIQEHAGDIWAKSQPGKGTTIHVELPIVLHDANVESTTPETPANQTIKQHLLVVDDEAGIRELLHRGLTGAGHTVDVSSDGQKAWEMIQEHSYDGIIADLKMPGMSGQRLFELVKDFKPDLAGKIAFITGDTASSETREFLDTTGNLALSKPFDLEGLVRQIQDFIAPAN